jgi:hypothetical protein
MTAPALLTEARHYVANAPKQLRSDLPTKAPVTVYDTKALAQAARAAITPGRRRD